MQLTHWVASHRRVPGGTLLELAPCADAAEGSRRGAGSDPARVLVHAGVDLSRFLAHLRRAGWHRGAAGTVFLGHTEWDDALGADVFHDLLTPSADGGTLLVAARCAARPASARVAGEVQYDVQYEGER